MGIAAPLTRKLTRQIARMITGSRGGGGDASFSPASLFSGGEQGAWYDPSDLSTMFQDVAGTVPVTTAGQTVARINDKSGRGNNATQATAASRPVYQTASGRHWLEFDGVDDQINSGAVNFSSTGQIAAFCGLRRLNAGSIRGIIRTDAINGFTLSFQVLPASGSLGCELFQGGASSTVAANSATATGVDFVVGALMDRFGATATDEVTLRNNGAAVASTVISAGPQANTNFTSAFSIQTPSSAALSNYRMYQQVVVGRSLIGAELSDLENYINTKTGAY